MEDSLMPSVSKLVTKHQQNPGEQGGQWRVFLVSEAAVLTARVKLLLGTCVAAEECSRRTKLTVGGTARLT